MTTTVKSLLGTLALGLMVLAGGVAPTPVLANSDAHANIGVAVGITEGGKVLVRGAKVTAISGSVITAQTSFGSASLNWTVNTDSSTAFSKTPNATANLSDIVVGDVISFAGTAEGTNIFVVHANAVKDTTQGVKPVTYKGIVTGITTSSTSLTLDKKNDGKTKTVTVTFSSATTVTLNGAASTFGNLAVNDGLKVTGVLSSDGTTLAATAVAATRPAPSPEDKDFSRLIKMWFSGKGFFNWNRHND